MKVLRALLAFPFAVDLTEVRVSAVLGMEVFRAFLASKRAVNSFEMLNAGFICAEGSIAFRTGVLAMNGGGMSVPSMFRPEGLIAGCALP